jgi:hypothetical protein
VPRIIVKVASPPAGLVVELDTKGGPRQIPPNQATEVDLGDYSVIVRARGYNEFISRLKINHEAKTTTVEAILRQGASNAEGAGVASGEVDDHPPAFPRRKLYAITAAAAGAGALIGGVTFGVLASSKWNEAKDVCGGTMCTTQDEVDRANKLGDSARTRATVSTVLVIAGVGLGGVGAYLWFTTPKDTTITPTASENSAGVTISGRF